MNFLRLFTRGRLRADRRGIRVHVATQFRSRCVFALKQEFGVLSFAGSEWCCQLHTFQVGQSLIDGLNPHCLSFNMFALV